MSACVCPSLGQISAILQVSNGTLVITPLAFPFAFFHTVYLLHNHFMFQYDGRPALRHANLFFFISLFLLPLYLSNTKATICIFHGKAFVYGGLSLSIEAIRKKAKV